MIYKNRALVRRDNTIYFGSMADNHIAMLQILSTKESLGQSVATKVLVQIQSTDESVSLKDRITKVAEKNSLFDALDIADIWLTRALKG